MKTMQNVSVKLNDSLNELLLTPVEAADFLRVSRSTIYQRLDIPRHRLPGSRQIRFLRSELLAWVRGELPAKEDAKVEIAATQPLLEIAPKTRLPYHRLGRYR